MTDLVANVERRNEVWAVIREVCGDDYADAAANFYELGGDSLLALQLLTELAETVGTEVVVGALLDADTMGAFVDDLLDPAGPQQ